MTDNHSTNFSGVNGEIGSAVSTAHVRVTVRLFAMGRELVGANFVELAVPAGCSLEFIKRTLTERFPALKPWMPRMLFAADNQYLGSDHRFFADRELLCFPPASGG